MPNLPPTKKAVSSYLGQYLFDLHVAELKTDDPDIPWVDICHSICDKYEMRRCDDDFDIPDKLARKLNLWKKDKLMLLYLQIPEKERPKLKGKRLQIYDVSLYYDPFGIIEEPEHTIVATSAGQALFKVLRKYTNHPEMIYSEYMSRMISEDEVIVNLKKLNSKRLELKKLQTDLFDTQIELF